MGATSIGWCALRLNERDEPVSVLDMGVRIFHDGRDAKSREPLSVTRRKARSARRRRDRYLLRRKDLMEKLVQLELMPASASARKTVQHIDPWQARSDAARKPVDPYILGRALFHINQRRGFKSNRLADSSGDETEIAGLKQGIANLWVDLGDQTLGQYLYERKSSGKHVRMRPSVSDSNKNQWDFYADREMYLAEFQTIASKQIDSIPSLTDDAAQSLESIIFRQRPLTIPEPGWCALLHNEKRSPLALPIVQKFRILQELNNLQIEDLSNELEPITNEQRLKIRNVLEESFEGITKAGYLGWKKIQKILGLSGRIDFNLNKAGRKGVFCNKTNRILSQNSHFGSPWFDLSPASQELIVTKILSEPNKAKLKNWLQDNYQLDPEKSSKVASCSLVKGYGHVSVKAIKMILPFLEQGLTYDKACALAGINHSFDHTGERFDHGDLPYYGSVLSKSTLGANHNVDQNTDPESYFGKINNPTVHIALNQLKLIINALYKRYRSAPQEVHIELARDLKNSPQRLAEITSSQEKNRKDNEKINNVLQDIGVQTNYNNRMRYKLWQDLAREPDRRVCPFSGAIIPLADLFSASYEIEHLLPFSRSFDDGRANKVICSRKANRDKRNQSPFEAFGHSPVGYDWNDILARVENMHSSKRWRFSHDAMEKLKGEHESIIARLLTDTQYMSKVARRYMEYVCAPNRVVATNGRLTAKLRHHWGCNSFLSKDDVKERGDHRHHAIDALVTACISRKTIQQVSTSAAKAESEYLERTIKQLPAPFEGFNLTSIKSVVENIVISYKPDNSNPQKNAPTGTTKGALHEETNYGLVGPSEKKGYSIYATRVPLQDIDKKPKPINEIACANIRADLLNEHENLHTSQSWKAFLRNYGSRNGVRRVRIHRQKSDIAMIPISDKQGIPYRYVQGGSNFCMDIWCNNKGSKAGKWQTTIVSMFDAHHQSGQPEWRKTNPTAWRVMRLHINDVLAYDGDGQVFYCRVKKIRSDGRAYLRPHSIAIESGDDLSIGASASWLQQHNARRIWVDPLGSIHDAGKARKVISESR